MSFRKAMLLFVTAGAAHVHAQQYALPMPPSGLGASHCLAEGRKWFQLPSSQANQDANRNLAKLDADPQGQSAETNPQTDAAAEAEARAEAAEDKKADTEEKIDELQTDIDGLREHIESLQSDIDQMGNCSGVGAVICQITVDKFKRDQNKAKRDIRAGGPPVTLILLPDLKISGAPSVRVFRGRVGCTLQAAIHAHRA